ncbi:hypothetical protein HKX48_002308, partial [Thoreauomyces humboldtii]
ATFAIGLLPYGMNDEYSWAPGDDEQMTPALLNCLAARGSTLKTPGWNRGRRSINR